MHEIRLITTSPLASWATWAAMWIFVVTGTAIAGPGDIAVDAGFPGGNIIVDGIKGNTIRLRPDLRDTEGNWFYWAFRVRGAQGRTLQFTFTQQQPIGARGPAVSLDEGVTWAWLGRANATNSSFTYACPADARSVRFSMGMPYTQENLKAFLKRIGNSPALRMETLTTSRKSRAVERLRVGKLDGEPQYRVLIMARHHACEMMASYAVEGVIEAALAGDDTGKWFRDNVELAVVPFVDKDGVEDGDQGKNRKPRDHNRDYSGKSLYPETAAIREWVPRWSAEKLAAVIDLHCPALRGARNEIIYQPGRADLRAWEQQQRFAALLEKAITGPLPYRATDDLPYGKEWNTSNNFALGESSASWAGKLPGVRLATTIELPYANAGGEEVNEKTARAFGRDLAKGLREYLRRLAPGK